MPKHDNHIMQNHQHNLIIFNIYRNHRVVYSFNCFINALIGICHWIQRIEGYIRQCTAQCKPQEYLKARIYLFIFIRSKQTHRSDLINVYINELISAIYIVSCVHRTIIDDRSDLILTYKHTRFDIVNIHTYAFTLPAKLLAISIENQLSVARLN